MLPVSLCRPLFLLLYEFSIALLVTTYLLLPLTLIILIIMLTIDSSHAPQTSQLKRCTTKQGHLIVFKELLSTWIKWIGQYHIPHSYTYRWHSITPRSNGIFTLKHLNERSGEKQLLALNFTKSHHSHVLLFLYTNGKATSPGAQFDTNSFLLMIDNCACTSITNCLDDFV